MRYWIPIFLILCAWLTPNPSQAKGALPWGPEFTGKVTGTDGQPLSKVTVYSRGKFWNSVETDSDGRFKIARESILLLFIKDGYAPHLTIVERNVTTYNAVLSEQSNHPQKIPTCESLKGRIIFGEFAFPKLPGIKTEEGHGIDVLGLDFWVKRKNANRLIVNFPDQYTLPDEKWLLETAEISRRSWDGNKTKGVDFQGRTKSGEQWRFVTLNWAEAHYAPSPTADAAVYDAILDGRCECKPEKKR